MTNGEKYKTAQERENAFWNFCEKNVCLNGCPLYKSLCNNARAKRTNSICHFAWLDLEAEEESFEDVIEEVRKRMIDREHSPSLLPFIDRLEAAHNRVAKAAAESEAK